MELIRYRKILGIAAAHIIYRWQTRYQTINSKNPNPLIPNNKNYFLKFTAMKPHLNARPISAGFFSD